MNSGDPGEMNEPDATLVRSYKMQLSQVSQIQTNSSGTNSATNSLTALQSDLKRLEETEKYIKELTDPNLVVRSSAAQWLGKNAGKNVLDQFVRALYDTSPYFRLNCYIAMGTITERDDSCYERVLSIFKDHASSRIGSLENRKDAIKAIGWYGRGSEAVFLENLKRDPMLTPQKMAEIVPVVNNAVKEVKGRQRLLSWPTNSLIEQFNLTIMTNKTKTRNK